MSTRGWAAIGGFVVAHNVAAAGRGTPMLSETMARWVVAHPVLVRSGIGLLALHLARLLPVDPITAASSALARKIGPLR